MKGEPYPTENRVRGEISCIWMTASNQSQCFSGVAPSRVRERCCKSRKNEKHCPREKCAGRHRTVRMPCCEQCRMLNTLQYEKKVGRLFLFLVVQPKRRETGPGTRPYWGQDDTMKHTHKEGNRSFSHQPTSDRTRLPSCGKLVAGYSTARIETHPRKKNMKAESYYGGLQLIEPTVHKKNYISPYFY